MNATRARISLDFGTHHETVPAEVDGPLALHPVCGSGGWAITHVATGYQVVPGCRWDELTEDQARRLLIRLRGLPWETVTDPFRRLPPALKAAAKRIITREMTAMGVRRIGEPAPESRETPENGGVTLDSRQPPGGGVWGVGGRRRRDGRAAGRQRHERVVRVHCPDCPPDAGAGAVGDTPGGGRLVAEALMPNPTHCGHPASQFAHGDEGTAHCPACEREGRLKWIADNLPTVGDWTLEDFREFCVRVGLRAALAGEEE